MSEFPHYPYREMDDTQQIDMLQVFKREEELDGVLPTLQEVAVEGLAIATEPSIPTVSPVEVRMALARSSRVKANILAQQIQVLEEKGEPVHWRLREWHDQHLANAQQYQQEAYGLAHPPRQWAKKIVGKLFGRKDQG